MTKGQLVGNTHSEKSCEDVSGLYSVSELLSSAKLDMGLPIHTSANVVILPACYRVLTLSRLSTGKVI